MSYKKSKIACIILASGNGLRFDNSKSKLFYKVHRTPIIEITLKNITKYLNKDSIYITISKKITKNEKKKIYWVCPLIEESEKIKEIAENIVKLIPTLIEKKMDLFSSKVNQNLNGI